MHFTAGEDQLQDQVQAVFQEVPATDYSLYKHAWVLISADIILYMLFVLPVIIIICMTSFEIQYSQV